MDDVEGTSAMRTTISLVFTEAHQRSRIACTRGCALKMTLMFRLCVPNDLFRDTFQNLCACPSKPSQEACQLGARDARCSTSGRSGRRFSRRVLSCLGPPLSRAHLRVIQSKSRAANMADRTYAAAVPAQQRCREHQRLEHIPLTFTRTPHA